MEGKGNIVQMLRYARDMNAGDEIEADDIELVPVEKALTEPLADVVTSAKRSFLIGRKVNKSANGGSWILWSHVTETSTGVIDVVPPGYRTVPVVVDPRNTPGNLLSVGSRVDLVATLSLEGKQPANYLVMEYVRVVSVGGFGRPGEWATDKERNKYLRGQSSYRTINIAVKEELMLDLLNVLSHAMEPVRLVLRNQQDTTAQNAERINPLLTPLSKKAHVARYDDY
jgi:Flp pilus assembly protein CpaB